MIKCIGAERFGNKFLQVINGMEINTDINILGGLPDWNLINVFMLESIKSIRDNKGIYAYTAIKTDQAVGRFQRAISRTLIKFCNEDVAALISNMLEAENTSNDSLLLLFWNASFNNDLFNYLNQQVYFVSFYHGRISIRADEVVACINDLKEREVALTNWADYTKQKVASKYLTLLKKFNLMEGSQNKRIMHPYLNDKMFIHFVYWISSIESKPNLLESEWLRYSFCERETFIERIMQKKYSKYFQLTYSGDKLYIDTLLPYKNIYHAID